MTLSLKFPKDPSFCSGDICKIMLNMHARGIIEHAKFQQLCLHVFALCAPVCARIFTKKFFVVHYSVVSLSLKFFKDPIFCWYINLASYYLLIFLIKIKMHLIRCDKMHILVIWLLICWLNFWFNFWSIDLAFDLLI